MTETLKRRRRGGVGDPGDEPRRTPRRMGLRDLPMQWKILVPFAALAVVYGALTTFVFARATVLDRRASVTADLRDVTRATTDELEASDGRLAASVRRIAGTQGVGAAARREDIASLRTLVVPDAVTSGRDLVVITDAEGRPLLSVSGASTEPAVRERPDIDVAAGKTEASDGVAPDLRAGFVRTLGRSYLTATGPILGPDGPVGAVVVGRELDTLVERPGSRATVGIYDADGAPLAGALLPTASDRPDVTTQFEGTVDGRRQVLLSSPVRVSGEPAGSLVVALPSPSGWQVLGADIWQFLLLSALALVAVFVVGMLVARWITHPLDQVLDGIRSMRRNDFSRRLRMERRDELGEVAAAFDEMAEAIEHHSEELTHTVEERTHDLQSALRKLKQSRAKLARANDAKSAFLANMSHELRSPLSGILIAAELLSKPELGLVGNGRPPDAAAIRDLGAKIHTTGTHLLALIDDLLDVARIEAGHMEITREEVDLAELLEDLQSTFHLAAQNAGVTLTMPSARSSAVGVDTDKLRLRQVLMNLLSNALKYTPAPGRVEIGVTSGERHVRISVTDTGVGIGKKDQARIFRPFEQVTDSPGVGLGLSISKRIMTLLDGDLRVTSRKGHGSTFVVTVPRARRTRRRTRAAARSAGA